MTGDIFKTIRYKYIFCCILGALSMPVGIFGNFLFHTENRSSETPNIMIYGMAMLPDQWEGLNWNIKPDVSLADFLKCNFITMLNWVI